MEIRRGLLHNLVMLLGRWDRNVLAVRDPYFQPATDAGRPADFTAPEPNPWLLQLGVPADVCRDVLNPGDR